MTVSKADLLKEGRDRNVPVLGSGLETLRFTLENAQVNLIRPTKSLQIGRTTEVIVTSEDATAFYVVDARQVLANHFMNTGISKSVSAGPLRRLGYIGIME